MIELHRNIVKVLLKNESAIWILRPIFIAEPKFLS